jgi:hypothetical protein
MEIYDFIMSMLELRHINEIQPKLHWALNNDQIKAPPMTPQPKGRWIA